MLLALLAPLVLAFPLPPTPQGLKPGDPAAQLRIETWLLGERVSPGKGSILVLDFWAPSNEQCVASQPYLSELAREYAAQGVRVLGVTGPDAQTTLERARQHIEEHADTLRYSLAWDTGVATRRAYFDGGRVPPLTYVLDAEGRVAWHGKPMLAVEVVAGLLAGTWDRARDPAALERDERELLSLYGLGLADPAGALEKLAALETRRPRLVALIEPLRFELALAAGAFELAAKTGRALAERAHRVRDVVALRRLVERLVDPARPLARPDLELARLAGERAVELTAARDYRALELLARVHRALGDLPRALELLTQAIQVAPPLAKASLLETLAELEKP